MVYWGLGSAGLLVGLRDLKGLFQPKWFYDHIICSVLLYLSCHINFTLDYILHLLQFYPQSKCEEPGKKAGIWLWQGNHPVEKKNSQSFLLVCVLRIVKSEQMAMPGAGWEMGRERRGNQGQESSVWGLEEGRDKLNEVAGVQKDGEPIGCAQHIMGKEDAGQSEELMLSRSRSPWPRGTSLISLICS